MLASLKSAPSALLFVLLSSSAARADDGLKCNAAYEKADLLVHSTSSDKLIEAREQLRACAHPSCKAWMTKDCAKWLSDVEQRIPTVVLAAKGADGTDQTDVTVSVDDKRIAERLDGRAIEMNPGPRVFVFIAADGRRVEQRAVVKEGEKSQLISVTLPKAAAGVAPAATSSTATQVIHEGGTSRPPSSSAIDEGGASRPPSSSPVATSAPALESGQGTPWRTLGWIAGGVGVVGLAVGAAFGLAAIDNNNQSNSNGACNADLCTGPGLSARHAALDDATASTVAFIAGGVLAATGVVLVFVAPSSGTSRGRLELAPVLGQNTAGAALGGSW